MLSLFLRNATNFNDFTGPKVKLPLFMQEVIGNLYRFILAFVCY